MNLKKVIATAERAALDAGQLLMKHYGKLKSSQISQKSRNDFVTTVDKSSERLIIARIQKNFPDHSIHGEESGRSGDGGTCWIIDPLDGTSNYIHQFPMFTVSIGVSHQGQMQAGVVYDPVHRELFSAVKGKGSYLNGKRFYVSPVKRLADGLIATGIPFRARDRFEPYFESLRRISRASVGIRRGGSAAQDLAYVACGRFDGFWEINLSPWDIAAGSLLIQEAGGKVSDMTGQPHYMKSGDILASNGRIHNELKAVTNSIFR